MAKRSISVMMMMLLCFTMGMLIKLPDFFPIDAAWYITRFGQLVIISSLVFYFLQKDGGNRQIQIACSVIAAQILYLILLPNDFDPASITMVVIHQPLLSLSLLAFCFVAGQWACIDARLNYIRYVGEALVYSVLILLGGMVLTATTLGLFSLIDLSITDWYFDNVVVLGLSSAPLVATYLFDVVQNRKSKLAWILANVFSPLFLVTVVIYLGAMFYQGQNPLVNRDFLITINGLLLIILAITIFSIADKSKIEQLDSFDYINAALVMVTLVIDVIALFAIVFRWLEFGMTVNRFVVTGVNLIIFVHLLIIVKQYFSCFIGQQKASKLQYAVAAYLPIYTVWAILVSLILPLAFGFK